VLWVAPDGFDQPDGGSVASPLQSIAYACERARAGETIRLRAGEFRETRQCVLRSGVRLMGNGRSGTTASVVYAPTDWDFRADGVEDDSGGYSVLIEGAADVVVDQIGFQGNEHRANGAILVRDAARVTLRELRITDYRYIGLNTQDAAQIDAQVIEVTNSGLEWPPGASSTFPDGGSLGNLGVRNVRDSLFGFIKIYTDELRGYGVKASNLSRVRFTNLDIDVYPFQSWMGPGPNNFDIEIYGGYAEEVEIAHSHFRQTLSLMGGNDPRYDAVPYSIHVHHNFFDMKNGSYSVEVGTDKMVFDHNWFRNTWTALQNYGESTTRIRDLTVFNNVVENLSMRFVGLKGRVENLRVFANTVYLSEGGGQSYLVTLGSNNESRNWLLANNVVVGSAANALESRQLVAVYNATTPPRQISVRNNVYRDLTMSVSGVMAADATRWDHVYSANIEADPQLPTSGDQAYQPSADSPVVDSGDPHIGIRTDFVGAGRDVGAFERGLPAWRAGLGSSVDVDYLWGPTSSVRQNFFVGAIDVDLSAEPGVEIRYTLDGSEPGVDSMRYERPIRIAENVRLRARSFRDGYGSASAFALDLSEGVRGYPNLGAEGSYSASSIYPEGDLYVPAKAFDGVTYSWIGWASAPGDQVPWLQVDLGAAARVRYIELYTRAQIDSAETRRNFEIRASNDPTFATYVVLAAQGNTALAHEGVFEQEVSEVGRYRYVRAAKTVTESFFITELRILGER
jgi:hypothetical protein